MAIRDWNGDATAEVDYCYSGLGQRINETVWKDGVPERTDYIVDLTRKGNNILQTERNNEIESYLSDSHVLGRLAGGKLQFYILDEMGSTLRLQWKNGNTHNIVILIQIM